MPLQIRRGTTAERTSITPLAGELIYDTTLKSVYIGDNATAGGVGVTGFTTEDAIDAVGAALLAGVHSGITFTYGPSQDTAGRIDATIGGGVVNLDIRGSVFSDDTSTILIDGVLAAINLDQTIKSNVVPALDVTYDLGTASHRFKDIYLSGSSIFLGNATITSTGSAVNLPTGSTVGGVPIGSGGGTGDGVISGSNYIINIIGDDSTLIVDSSTKSVTAGGGLYGDLKGSVFGDNSTKIVDAVENKVYAEFFGNINGNLVGDTFGIHFGNMSGDTFGVHTGNIITSLVDSADSSAIQFVPLVSFQSDVVVENDLTVNNNVTISKKLTVSRDLIVGEIRLVDDTISQAFGDTEVGLKLSFNRNLNLTGKIIPPGLLTPDLESTAYLNVFVSTYLNPDNPEEIVADNAPLYANSILCHNGTNFVESATMFFLVDGTVTPAADSVPTKFGVALADGTNEIGVASVMMTFDSLGTLSAPTIQTGVYTDTPETRPTGVKGMIIFNDTTGKFQGYTGAAWVDLS